MQRQELLENARGILILTATLAPLMIIIISINTHQSATPAFGIVFRDLSNSTIGYISLASTTPGGIIALILQLAALISIPWLVFKPVMDEKNREEQVDNATMGR